MIRRNGPGNYVRISKKAPATQRRVEDFDLRFSGTSIYVLGENEWWDPMTSTKYHNGVSAHAMYGPSLIIFYQGSGGGYDSNEYHVNDPRPWVWVQECIKKGYLNADTCDVLLPKAEIVIEPEEVKPRKKRVVS